MKELIFRNTPEIADCFELREIESDNGQNRYEVFCENGKTVICGDCKLSQAMGYGAYLKKYCGVDFSRCGNAEISVSEAPLFEGKISKTVKQDKRVYLGYAAYGYSLAFADWSRWEKEIDIMAMNGVNLSLCLVGSEAVWYYTMRDFKYSETGALNFLSGPAFWPWQITSNIESYFSLTDVEYIEKRAQLGKKIIEREVSLGITPILPGFSGMVPQSFTKLFKKLRLQIVPSWCNFQFTYQLDTANPVFKKFGTALLEKQRQLFGAYHYYACDPFKENVPGIKNKEYFWKLGRAIDTLFAEFDPESKWVIHSGSAREKLVKSVPKERLLIIDTDGKSHSLTNNFWGYDFILGEVGNRGDRSALHGNMKALAENPFLDMPENCRGVGIFSEGIMQNPMYFDLAFEMLTEDKKIDLGEWCAHYAFRRYGSDEKELAEAVKIICDNCCSDSDGECGSIICARPCTDLKHAAPYDTMELKYDNKELLRAAELLLGAEKADKDGLIYDICDVTRQVLSNHAHTLYHKAIDGFNKRDVNLFERSSNGFLKICEELDELLQTRSEFTLHSHLKEAGEAAFTDKDKQNFELNLLSQITIWGPVGSSVNYDYAWKEWGGLIGTFYAKRWQSFYELLAYRFAKHGKFSTVTKKQIDGRNIYRGNEFYKSCFEFERKWLSTANPEAPSDGDTVETARRLIEKYSKAVNG